MHFPEPIRGAVFDFDGLLADTEPTWGEIEGSLFARRGLTYGPVERSWFLGASVGDTVTIMSERFGEDVDALMAEMEDVAGAAFRKEVRPMPGAVELVHRLRRAIPVAIASNTTNALLRIAVSGLGLPEVPVMVASDDVARPKPAPDMYLRACELLGVPPAECVAFEDSVTGAAAARAAGLFLVAVPTVPGSVTDADLILESLADPLLERIG